MIIIQKSYNYSIRESYSRIFSQIIDFFIKNGKVSYAKAFLHSQYIQKYINMVIMLRRAVIENNIEFVKFLLNEHDYTFSDRERAKSVATSEISQLL